MLTAILELITLGAKIFDKERSLYYINKAAKLQEKIQKVVDSEFYKKDMEAKGRAERELEMDTTKLRLEFVSEAKGK